MKFDLAFEFGSLDKEMIIKILSDLNSLNIQKIEVISSLNSLDINPITNEPYKNKVIIFSSLAEFIGSTPEVCLDFPSFKIKTIKGDVVIDHNSNIIGVLKVDLDYIKKILNTYLQWSNFLTLVIFNPKDKLLESIGVHQNSLKSNSGVNFYPGIITYINKKIEKYALISFDTFKPSYYSTDILELSFSNNENDITTIENKKMLFGFFDKKIYTKSSLYKLQIEFVKFILEKKVIETFNIQLNEMGFIKYLNKINDGKLETIYYLNSKGESVYRRFAVYKFIELSFEGQIIEAQLSEME